MSVNIQNTAIGSWLKQIKLENLVTNFTDNGIYENIGLIKILNESDNFDKLLITTLGIDKPGYRDRIIVKILEDCNLIKK